MKTCRLCNLLKKIDYDEEVCESCLIKIFRKKRKLSYSSLWSWIVLSLILPIIAILSSEITAGYWINLLIRLIEFWLINIIFPLIDIMKLEPDNKKFRLSLFIPGLYWVIRQFRYYRNFSAILLILFLIFVNINFVTGIILNIH
jgi:hypothetical protein